MINYAQNQTILLLTDQSDVQKTVQHVVNTSFKNVQIFCALKAEDLLGVPCFLIIMDAKHLNSAILNSLEELFEEEESMQPMIVIQGSCSDEIPKLLQKRILLGYDLFRNLPVRKLIKKEFDRANGKGGRKEAFKEMIRRIIDTIEKEKKSTGEVSKSSIYRDHKIIKRASALSEAPAPCKRPERILAIYLYMRKNIYLSRSAACGQFGITERTLNRDLALLAEVLNIDPYYYDDFNGCYS